MKNYIQYCNLNVIISTITRHYCHSNSFQALFFTTLNLIQDIIIIRISHNYRIYLYGFFA